VWISSQRAAAEGRPRTPLNLYILGVAFVSFEERSYGGLLGAFFYHMVVSHHGHLPLPPDTSVDNVMKITHTSSTPCHEANHNIGDALLSYGCV
jgi:hypothetical protein